jgi:hypothetical protein
MLLKLKILLFVLKILLLLLLLFSWISWQDPRLTGPASRPNTLERRHDPMLLGPRQDPRLLGPVSGPKRIEFDVSAQFSWV